MIVLRALGTAEIDTGVTTMTPSQDVTFATALYLILEHGSRISRARLTSLLWPRAPQQSRAHRLRQTILQLKKLGVPVTADRASLGLAPGSVQSDVVGLSAEDCALAFKYESLEFLPGYSP